MIPSLLILIQPLDFIFYEILPVLNILHYDDSLTVDSLFLPKAIPVFTYLLMNNETTCTKLLTPPYADKKMQI